jgi:iodotyrosine deiodinase
MPCNPRHLVVPAPRYDLSAGKAKAASRRLLEAMSTRRTIRDFAPARPVDPELIENAIRTAATAPSGANIQPWRFVVVTDPDVRTRIRERVERVERAFYEGPLAEWHEALTPLGTDWHKPHLTDAPYLVVVFEVHQGFGEPKPYYVKESVGIAVGLLLTSLHQAGLATFTHAPSPMRFLNSILLRPVNERPFCIVAIGYPSEGATVPDIARKPLEEILVWRERADPDVGGGE